MKTVLFIMPFNTKTFATGRLKLRTQVIKFNENYQEYKKSIESLNLGYKVYRVDDSHINDIDLKMFNMINLADVVFADVTHYTANVMYELGVRHALKDKITIIFQSIKNSPPIPFDISHFDVKKTSIFKDKKILKELLMGQKNVKDSPVLKNLRSDINPFPLSEDISSNWIDFDKKYKFLRENEEYKELNALVDEYDDSLSHIEAFDQRKALVNYKNNESLPGYKKSLKIILRYDPMNNNDYETISLYASITRKIYENEETEPNRIQAQNAVNYFLAKHHDASTISSYYMFSLVECEYGKLTYQELVLEFKKLKDITLRLHKSRDNYLYDTIQTIDYALGIKNESEIKFKFPNSSIPVIKRLKIIKERRDA